MEFMGPYIVPLAVFAWLAIVGVAKIVGQAQARRVMAEQRMVMLQRGMTPEQIAAVLQPTKEDDAEQATKIKDPLRSLGNARRAGIVLVSIGIGLSIFGVLLASIVGDHEVLVVAAAGLIPIAIGIGFFVDYSLQKRELSRFGLEVGAEFPPTNRPT
jgi:Flp pilus assembly protein TadB